MARILIIEFSPEVRDLLTTVLGGAGHDTVSYTGARSAPPADVDVLLLEPATAGGLDCARLLRARDPELPIVCFSIEPKSPATAALHPIAYLVKPGPLAELLGAVGRALAVRAAVEQARPP
ncbi:MAG: hypothetical protein LC790_12125 [Actinobacteria bacterium]|nr:hypothetical protein [Actinomycetota bacterium]